MLFISVYTKFYTSLNIRPVKNIDGYIMDNSSVEFLFNTDYKSYSLKPVEQLVCIRMLYLSFRGQSISLSNIADVCNCSKQTVYSAASKLVSLGLFDSHQSNGKVTQYDVNPDFFDVNSISTQESEPFLANDLPDAISADLSQGDLWDSFDSSSIFKSRKNIDDVDGNFMSLENVHVDALLEQGHEPTHLVQRHCVPSNTKRSKARKKRKRK